MAASRSCSAASSSSATSEGLIGEQPIEWVERRLEASCWSASSCCSAAAASSVEAAGESVGWADDATLGRPSSGASSSPDFSSLAADVRAPAAGVRGSLGLNRKGVGSPLASLS